MSAAPGTGTRKSKGGEPRMVGGRYSTTHPNLWGREAFLLSFWFLSAPQERMRSVAPRFVLFHPQKKQVRGLLDLTHHVKLGV